MAFLIGEQKIIGPKLEIYYKVWLQDLRITVLSEFLVTVYASCNDKKYILSRESVFNDELNPIFKVNILDLVLVIQIPL